MTTTYKSKTKLEISSSASHTMRLKKASIVNDDTALTPAEAKQVRRAEKNIKEGRFKLWRDVKHELAR